MGRTTFSGEDLAWWKTVSILDVLCPFGILLCLPLTKFYLVNSAKKFLKQGLGWSQRKLNLVVVAVCLVFSLVGAKKNAYEASFDSLSSVLGLAPPTFSFNNVLFIDEFVGSLAMMLTICQIWGLIVVPMRAFLAMYVALVAVLNRNTPLHQQRYLPPFHYTF